MLKVLFCVFSSQYVLLTHYSTSVHPASVLIMHIASMIHFCGHRTCIHGTTVTRAAEDTIEL